jgi:hypothetical protein
LGIKKKKIKEFHQLKKKHTKLEKMLLKKLWKLKKKNRKSENLKRQYLYYRIKHRKRFIISILKTSVNIQKSFLKWWIFPKYKKKSK